MSTAEDATTTPPAAARLDALDGLRGAAAVVVVASHLFDYNSLPSDVFSVLLLSPLGLLVNGGGAVHVFFVLSGFVLALTLSRDDRPGRFHRYYVRRWFRIHPPYVAAVLFAWLLASLLGAHGLLPAEPWKKVAPQRFVYAFLFPSRAFGLLTVGWSLFVEMAMSVIFPLLFALGRRIHWGVGIGLGLLFLFESDPRWKFLRFLLDFAIGLCVFLESDRLARLFARRPRAAATAAIAGGVAFLQLPYASGLAATGFAGLEEGQSSSVVVPFALGSALLVAAAVHCPPLRRALSVPIGRFFGRVSYSLYLVHLPVVCVVEYAIFGMPLTWRTALLGFGIALPVSTAFAELGWRFVEKPAIDAGRAVIRAVDAALEQRPA